MPATIELPVRLSAAQAAEYIGVCRTLLALDRMSGLKRLGVPYARVGRQAVYTRDDLDRWMEARTVTPPNQASSAPVPAAA
jgi:hypothetical protein